MVRSVTDKLNIIALHSKAEEDFNECLRPFNIKVEDLDSIGNVGILLNSNGSYIGASVRLNKEDIMEIEKWGREPFSFKISIKKSLYQLNINSKIFVFNKYLNPLKTKIVLAGVFLAGRKKYMMISTLLASRVMNLEIQKELCSG